MGFDGMTIKIIYSGDAQWGWRTPQLPQRSFNSPLRMAKKGYYNKTLFLLKLGMSGEGRAQIRDEGLYQVMGRYKDAHKKQMRKERCKTKNVA
jgi:hypothetical protein